MSSATDVIGRPDSTNNRTEFVHRTRPPLPAADAPPPPVVIPPPRRRMPSSPRARRRRRRIIMLIAVLVLGALSVGGGLTGVRFFREWNTHVPKVAGVSPASARSMLHQAGYAIADTTTTQFSDTVAKNVVIRTVPAADSRLAQGKAVRLVVSLGKDQVPVPDLAGQRLLQAEQTLQSRGLSYNPAPSLEYSLAVPQGSVIRTEPKAGQLIARGGQVTLVQSRGLPSRPVPTFDKHTTFDKASRALRKAHFKVHRAADEYNDLIDVGDVVSVSPTGRQQYGSTVTVTVSKGPQPVSVPDYTKLHTAYSDYESALEALKLVPNVQLLLGGTNGVVADVSPEPGTQLLPGDTVTVTVI